jgi:hypothetical protein
MAASSFSAAARLRLERNQALRELAAVRLAAPERDRLLKELDAAEEGMRQFLGPEPSERMPISTAIVAKAEEKAAQAEADREEKRKPYEADPLFMYLWRRRFGTREYQASALVRALDRKVAHLIDYETARVNYTMLMELPQRLREHAERLRASGTATAVVLSGGEERMEARYRAAVGKLRDWEVSRGVDALLDTARRDATAGPAELVARIENLDRAIDQEERSADEPSIRTGTLSAP